MALPINIEDLINTRTVESSRVEFKQGWNPEEVIRTICAFTNDINELGGGYVIIGIEEKDGSPILPPSGIEQSKIDTIQKELIELCFKIKPSYPPVLIEPTEYQGKFIIIIWVTTGEERPYDAPTTLGKKAQRRIYVRPSSATIPSNQILEKRLRELAIYRHFDDRINTRATISDLNLGLIQAYLQEINSQLFEQITSMSMEELCLRMQIARGPNENVRPLNIGILLFCVNPENFFRGCFTNLVEFDDEAGTSYTEKQFTGPIHFQIREIMSFLNNNVIKDFTRKNGKVLEVDKFTNYPYQALEEAIVNALYHRSYENPMPNEIRIYKYKGTQQDTRRIEILSYPGPLPPINETSLTHYNITARNYRNIRLGDWLKNLRLAEKYATGIPTMVKSLRENGSPNPILSTDKERSHFLVVFKIHPDTPYEKVSLYEEIKHIVLSDLQQSILELLLKEPATEESLNFTFKKDLLNELMYLESNKLIGKKGIGQVVMYFINAKGIDTLKTSF